MDLQQIDDFVRGLEGCTQRRAGNYVGWYVNGLLVVRPDAPGTILIRTDRAQREALLERSPHTFGVPPRWEAHDKLQANLDGDPAAIKDAIRQAWRRQSGR